MNVPASPQGGTGPSHPKNPGTSGRWPWKWLVLLALVVGVPFAYLAFNRGTVPSSPPAVVSSGTAGDYIVYGQVIRQGRYALAPEDHLTASQAILRAGGFAPGAKDKAVKIIRKVPGKGNVTLVVNLRDVMTRGMRDKDLPLLPNDTIIVEERLINF